VPGIAWDARANGITSLYPGPVVISPTFAVDDTIFFAHVGLWRSTDRGLSWTKLDIDPTITVVRSVGVSPTFASDGILFFGTSAFGAGTPSKGVWKSVDGGDSFQLSDTGLPSNLKVRDFQFSPDWPADPTVYLAGRNLGVFRSHDGGAHWEEVNNGLGVSIIRVLRISPDDSRDATLFAGTAGGGLFVTHDGGATWSPSNAGLPDLAGIDVEGVAVSPAYAIDRTLFVTTQRSGVWRSGDGGATWQPVNAGLPLDMPRFIEPSPDFAHDRTLFLSTHDWMWRSVDAGATWHRLPGYVRVPDDHPLMVYNQLWARGALSGTHGGGVRKSHDAGDWFEWSFHGDSVQWLASTDTASGTAAVHLDGQLVEVVDLYSDPPVSQRVAWSTSFASAGWHTLRVVVTGQANPASSDAWVLSDGVAFTF